MKEIDLSARSLGVNFNQAGEAHIVVWAPLLESVEIYLEKPRVMYPLMKDKYGYWELTTPELKPGDLYQFVLNDGRHVPDPASISQPYGVHGSSQALDLQSYPWTDQSWKNPQLEDYIFYELHVGTFSEEGTFAGIESKLDYLVDLGITAIELMPVAQFPGKRNWGYDGVYPFAVQDSYGGPEGLKHLVNACHEKGLAVVLDVVYNHMGPEGNYFSLYGPYFTKQYRTPWGDAINFDDEWSDGVRDYFIENTLMWFRDYHIDGLRLDAVHAIRDFSPVHILREIKQYVNDLSRETGRNHYLIVEMELNDNRFINSFDKGGYGMDAQWSDEFHHALRVSAGGERTGYYADMDGTAAFAKAYQNAYVHTGEYTFRRNKTFGTPTEPFQNHQFVVFSQNHDHIGNRMNGDRSSQLTNFEMLKVMAGSVITSPFLPLLFMGEEWAESRPFLYFTDHTDPELSTAVREGRKKEFAAFHGEGEAPDPTIQDSFDQSKLEWNLQQDPIHNTLYKYYRQLIQIRKDHPLIRQGNRQDMDVMVDEAKDVIVVRRWHQQQQLLIAMNFSCDPYVITVSDQAPVWKKCLDSADPQWGGEQASPDELQAGTLLTLQPESILMYSHE